tara:strand:- start:8736 stop:9182 length:447 start_codon:yes stop_codon:yes gene_type:complete
VKQLQDHVVVPEGSSFVPTSLDGTKDYYLLYYSAHWCPPCRKFTPVFVKAYNELREKGIDNFEVILVGYDYTEDKMLHYMEIAHMPWLAVDYSKRKDIPIVNDLAARGIPNLVVLNRAGNVLLRTYVGDTYVGPYKVLEDFVKLVDPL